MTCLLDIPGWPSTDTLNRRIGRMLAAPQFAGIDFALYDWSVSFCADRVYRTGIIGSFGMALEIVANCEPIPGYRLLERLGGGGFGEVWKAEAPGGLHKAIKIIHGDLRLRRRRRLSPCRAGTQGPQATSGQSATPTCSPSNATTSSKAGC